MKSKGRFQMKLSLILTLLLAVCVAALGQQAMPRMTVVEPGNGKAGDVIAVTGENLEKTNVAKVYLTDGKNDTQVEVTDQTATSIKFKIPPKAAAGKFSLMILTTGNEARLIEQPVKLTVEE
jgi:hypothetical protein